MATTYQETGNFTKETVAVATFSDECLWKFQEEFGDSDYLDDIDDGGIGDDVEG